MSRLHKEELMTMIEEVIHPIPLDAERRVIDEAELAAVAFLARYSGRTLDAYRHDLRNLFLWAADHDLAVLEATRAHLEMYRSSMETRGLAASTIDRRLSTACGFYRFAHIDGRIASNPAQYVRRPQVHPSERRGLDRSELGRFLFTAERFDHAHAALAVDDGRKLSIHAPAKARSFSTGVGTSVETVHTDWRPTSEAAS